MTFDFSVDLYKLRVINSQMSVMQNISSTLSLCLFFVSAFSWAQNSTGLCDLFEEGTNDNWPFILTATTPEDEGSSDVQTLDINVVSMPEGASYRVAKTVANGNWFFGDAVPLELGENAVSVSAVEFDRTVKFQFSSGDIEFDALAVNGDVLTCAGDLDGVAMETCAGVDDGPNATWPHVVTATTPDDPNSADAQSMGIFVTALPPGGANYRVVKTVANGNWFQGNAVPLSLGVNDVTVSAVSFARSVKFQFSSGLIEFTELSVNGGAISCVEDGCEDADGDGICDDVDPCVGALDACGICNGPGEVYECGCSDIPEGDCDCEGNQADALGICGGSCQSDDNDNGICDADEEVVDPSVYCGAGTIWNAALNQCIAEAAEDLCPADLDGDGSVSTGDLLQFLAAFGQPC